MERFFMVCATIKIIAVEIVGVLLFLAVLLGIGYLEAVHLAHTVSGLIPVG